MEPRPRRRTQSTRSTQRILPDENSAISASSALNPRARVDLAHLPQDDPAVYAMLREADTIGVFQVESRAQMATLPRLQARLFLRPRRGGGDHPARADRRADGAPVSESARRPRAGQYPHPSLEPILARTLGVPLFQEQLLRIAMVAAGFTGGQAEDLRRAMGFKRSERRMKPIEVQLRDGMAQQGHYRRRRRADHHVDRVVCAVRLSRVARRELRAARVRERVSQGALSRGVLHGAAQQPADGVLPSVDARQGRAAPGRAISSDRRAAVGLGLHRRSRRRASGWGCATSAAFANRRSAGESRTFRPLARPGLPARPGPPVQPALVCPKCGCDDRIDARTTDGGQRFCNVCSHHSDARFARGR